MTMKNIHAGLAHVAILAICLCLAGVGHAQVSQKAFEIQALPALAVEEPFDFIRQQAEGLPPSPRDPGACPLNKEIEISTGWVIELPDDATLPLVTAGEELQRYLKEAMGVTVELKRTAHSGEGRTRQKVIVAAARDKMPGCGELLKAPKDYQISVANNAVTVCGFDERGAMYGLYNLIMRFCLREAPFLPKDLDTVRHSLYKARMTLSGLGWMEWPDRYLATLPLYGYDAIYCSVYRNANNAPAEGPYWNDMRKHAPGDMKNLLRRAARFGIDCYVPLLYRYEGTPESEAGLRKLVREIVTEFPEIRGYVLLSEGFSYGNWFKGNTEEERRTWLREWTKAVGIATEEAHKVNPALEILPWDYNVSFSPANVPLKTYVMTQLSTNTIPLLTFENGKGYELDGQKGYLRDYAINQVGPSEVTEAQVLEARKRNFRGVYAKADTSASWQFGTFPYLPFPYQWHARYKALEKWKIDGTLESWSYGFKPNWVSEIRAWTSWSDAPSLDDLLKQIARREFGAGNEEAVLAAWRHFSEAIQVYPDTGPNWGSCAALASPLFFEKPKPRTFTLNHAWADQTRWSHQAQVNPCWPYMPSRLFFWPDFTNQRDAAKDYIGFFTVPVFQKYLTLSADRMEQGLQSYRHAALRAPATKQKRAFREVLLAEQLQRMMRSEYAIIAFEGFRLALAKASDPAAKKELLDKMIAVLRDERERTASAQETARRDSRIGYEWEQDYVYTPDTIQEKINLIDDTLNRLIPAYRQVNGL